MTDDDRPEDCAAPPVRNRPHAPEYQGEDARQSGEAITLPAEDLTKPSAAIIDFASVVHARKGRSDAPAEATLSEADWRMWSFRAQMDPHAAPPSFITNKE